MATAKDGCFIGYISTLDAAITGAGILQIRWYGYFSAFTTAPRVIDKTYLIGHKNNACGSGCKPPVPLPVKKTCLRT